MIVPRVAASQAMADRKTTTTAANAADTRSLNINSSNRSPNSGPRKVRSVLSLAAFPATPTGNLYPSLSPFGTPPQGLYPTLDPYGSSLYGPPGDNFLRSAPPAPLPAVQQPGTVDYPPREQYIHGPTPGIPFVGSLGGPPSTLGGPLNTLGGRPTAPRLQFNAPPLSQQPVGASELPESTTQRRSQQPVLAADMLEVPIQIDQAELIKKPDGMYCRLGITSAVNKLTPDGVQKVFKSHVTKVKRLGDWPEPRAVEVPSPVEPSKPDPTEPCDSREWEPTAARYRGTPISERPTRAISKKAFDDNEPPKQTTPPPAPAQTRVIIFESPPVHHDVSPIHEEGGSDSGWVAPILVGTALVGATGAAVAAIVAHSQRSAIAAAPSVATGTEPVGGIGNALLCKHGNYRKHCASCLEPPTEVEFRLPGTYLT